MADAPFQDRVQPWMIACFGAEISADRVERADRLLEEVFELLQSGGYDPARVLSLRDYVWGREIGDPAQEVGGVMVTLAAYSLAHDLDMHVAGETELARIWTKVEKIRAKQADKPTGSALPVAVSASPAPAGEPAREWRCFHCDEVFTEEQAARDHFGALTVIGIPITDPACCIDIGKFRDMEHQLLRYSMEDSDKDREFHAMRADHASALIDEEQKGYDRGLRDGRALAPVGGRPTGQVSIAHDGFSGEIIGHYTTREGKPGVVVQQDGTRVVHVYGEKWLSACVQGGEHHG